MTDIQIPVFEPRIYEKHGEIRYDDGRVTGGLLHGSPGVLSIYEWSSFFKGKGHTVEALRWLRSQGYTTIVADGVGMIYDGEADPSVHYWEKMRSKGLVDELIDDESVKIKPGWNKRHTRPESPSLF
ncbi:hypothetical protein ACYPKM_04785 [Pseudomonas aeruginosa]